jgi:8-oxo-dGTP diphosphatase
VSAKPRHQALLVTVSFVHDGESVLLVRHPDDNDRFAGQWNGIGGHVEEGEGIRAAARRELREETGLDVPGLTLRGVVHESGLLGRSDVLFVFAGRAARREPASPEGLELRWHRISELSSLPLVHDVAVLLPRALGSGDPFFATETYDGGDRRLSMHFDDERDHERDDEPEPTPPE